MENNQTTPKESKIKFFKNFNYDKHYKTLFFIPFVILLISLIYLGIFYSQTGDILYKDVSLSGGTSITINGNVSQVQIEDALKLKFPDVSFTVLEDITTGKQVALMIESSASSEELKEGIEEIIGYTLNEDNSSTEFTGASLGKDFYKQLMIALLISFFLMTIVIFILFRTFTPSSAVIFAIFADIVMPLALIDFLGIKISSAGIAAFLMLVGYSVDTDILLTSRALKSKNGSLNSRIFGAFKTGSFMTITALAAVLPAFFIITGLPDSFRQIFLILALGLFADLINTWLTNASIIKWYCMKKGIQ
jgi:preprotein translocase subunit SecF